MAAPNERDIRVLVQVGVGVELASHEVLDLAGVRRKDEGQAVDLGIHGSHGLDTTSWVRNYVLRPADDKAEGEDKVIIVGKLQEEGGACSTTRFGVLR